MGSQHQLIKALQHAYIMKTPTGQREEHAEKKRKQFDNRDTRLSNTVSG
jgi:hypothetical protein